MSSFLLELFGQLVILLVLILIALLSKRLGTATRAKPQHFGFYVAIALMLVSIAFRIANIMFNIVPLEHVQESLLWILIYNGLPATALTLGVFFAWHYWSWLLAESA